MFKEFRKFILRGNVVDLAVGIVIGAAFTGLVNAMVNDFITPIIGIFGGKDQFSNYFFTVNDSKFMYGDFINKTLAFLLVAAVVFFLVVQPINKLTEKFKNSKDTEEATTTKCPQCLGEVPKAAKRCMHCTSALTPKK